MWSKREERDHNGNLDLSGAAKRAVSGESDAARAARLADNERRFGPEVWGSDGDRDRDSGYWSSRK